MFLMVIRQVCIFCFGVSGKDNFSQDVLPLNAGISDNIISDSYEWWVDVSSTYRFVYLVICSILVWHLLDPLYSLICSNNYGDNELNYKDFKVSISEYWPMPIRLCEKTCIQLLLLTNREWKSRQSEWITTDDDDDEGMVVIDYLFIHVITAINFCFLFHSCESLFFV